MDAFFLELQDTLVVKPPKKSPVFLRMIVLVFAMVCGVYICSLSVKQTNIHTNTRFLKIEVIERLSHDYVIDQVPYLHYPKPKTFSR